MIFESDDLLQAEFHTDDIDQSRPTGITGGKYEITDDVISDEEASQAYQLIADECEAKAIDLMNRAISIATSLNIDVQSYLMMLDSMHENADNIVSMELDDPGILGVVGGIDSLRKTSRHYALLGELGIKANEPALHRIYHMNNQLDVYDSTLSKSARLRGILDYYTQGAATNEIDIAVRWLIERDMPVDAIKSLINGRIQSYRDRLMSEIYNRINIVTYHVLRGPAIISQGLYKARNEVLRPIYSWISQLPSMPNEVDQILMDILREADRISTDSVNKISDMLKLSVFERYVHERQTKLMEQCERMYSIDTYIDKFTQDRYTEI